VARLRLAVLAHQSNGGEANYYETMVCNNYLSINVYLMKRHRGQLGVGLEYQFCCIPL